MIRLQKILHAPASAPTNASVTGTNAVNSSNNVRNCVFELKQITPLNFELIFFWFTTNRFCCRFHWPSCFTFNIIRLPPMPIHSSSSPPWVNPWTCRPSSNRSNPRACSLFSVNVCGITCLYWGFDFQFTSFLGQIVL